MKRQAGERLFEAIGRLPDKFILEAGLEGLDMAAEEEGKEEEGKGKKDAADAGSAGRDVTGSLQLQEEKDDGRQRMKRCMARFGGFLKYLPAAACLCLVFGGVYYVIDNTANKGDMGQALMSSGSDASGMQENGNLEENVEDKLSDGYGSGITGDAGMSGGASESGSSADGHEGQQPYGNAQNAAPSLPVRYDAYEGPIFPMTATGDIQKLKVGRTLKASVILEGENKEPLLDISDTYQIKNTSGTDKAIQLVYPFTGTLNLAYDIQGDMIKTEGIGQYPAGKKQSVSYSIGDSVRAYSGKTLQEACTAEDYAKILGEGSSYQEHALEKEVNWNREVTVYTFDGIKFPEGFSDYQAVAGVAVTGTNADVLTYGFDYSAKVQEGVSNYSFFASGEQGARYLIVTGETDTEPELGFYTNLDCVESIEGIECEMQRQEMPYADALRLCSNAAARKLEDDYGQGVYEGMLPPYMDGDAAFAALTAIDGEDGFYDTVASRYQGTELSEVFGQLFGETRIIYAMSTVTIPAGESIRVTAKAQKRQNNGHYQVMDMDKGGLKDGLDGDIGHAALSGGKQYQYDLLDGQSSRLQIGRQSFKLTLPEGWQAGENNLGLKEVKKPGQKSFVWKAGLGEEKASYFTVQYVLD